MNADTIWLLPSQNSKEPDPLNVTGTLKIVHRNFECLGAKAGGFSIHPLRNTMVDKLLIRLLSVDRRNLMPGETVSEYEINHLCQDAKRVLLNDPMLLELSGPVTIFGDIHGQYIDLLRWLDRVKMPPESKFLFLGDYVDRGDNSIEVMCLLLALKIKFPEHVFLLRGNHEISGISYDYGFYDECCEAMDESVWYSFKEIFDYLPIAAVVNGSIFCVHGGLSPELESLEQIRELKRPLNPDKSVLVSDLLWGDPTKRVEKFEDNTDRGHGYFFGEEAVKEFLQKMGLSMVCRGHEVMEKGFKIHFPETAPVATVFSAPNYCGDYDNTAAVMNVDGSGRYSFTFLCPMDQDNETISEPDETELRKELERQVELSLC